MKKIRIGKWLMAATIGLGTVANVAALDTAQLHDITASLDTASSWLSGP